MINPLFSSSLSLEKSILLCSAQWQSLACRRQCYSLYFAIILYYPCNPANPLFFLSPWTFLFSSYQHNDRKIIILGQPRTIRSIQIRIAFPLFITTLSHFFHPGRRHAMGSKNNTIRQVSSPSFSRLPPLFSPNPSTDRRLVQYHHHPHQLYPFTRRSRERVRNCLYRIEYCSRQLLLWFCSTQEFDPEN